MCSFFYINSHSIVPPTVIRLPRYTKAAGDQGSQVTLNCFIRTEPGPKVAWLKDGQLIQVTEGQLHSKYQIGLKHIRPGLYKATLVLSNLQKTDFGKYQCQVGAGYMIISKRFIDSFLTENHRFKCEVFGIGLISQKSKSHRRKESELLCTYISYTDSTNSGKNRNNLPWVRLWTSDLAKLSKTVDKWVSRSRALSSTSSGNVHLFPRLMTELRYAFTNLRA